MKPEDYEELLADYSSITGAIALLKQYRPYLEMLPSMRRPDESIISIPLPVVKLRNSQSPTGSAALRLDCETAILMCDPEWKIKTGVEVFVLIHRPNEDFSVLLGRWRQLQVCLSQGYEWDLPLRYKHILNEGAVHRYPLFVVFDETPDRIKRGLKGAFLPFVVQPSSQNSESDPADESEPALGVESKGHDPIA